MSQVAEKLFAEALQLPPAQRAELGRRLLASTRSPASSGLRRGRARWETLRAVRGVVHLGGDALADCEQLYDDDVEQVHVTAEPWRIEWE